MKTSDFYVVEDDYIRFLQTGNRYPIKRIEKVDVYLRPVLKNAVNTVLNAIANAMTSSRGNGNEQMQVFVTVKGFDFKEEILINEALVIRGNLDYYEMVEHARNLQKRIKALLKD